MKKYIQFVLTIVVAGVSIMTQAATLFCVHDNGLNDSQFCQGVPPYVPMGLTALGPTYPNCDIEALDNREAPIDEIAINLYAASGDDTPRKGHLYRFNKCGLISGPGLHDVGNIMAVDPNTGQVIKDITEVDAITFHPKGTLWGWGQHTGLFFIPPPYPLPSQQNEIDPKVGCLAAEPQVDMIPATVVMPRTEMEMEDLTWNQAGSVLYGVENVHDDPVDSHGDPETNWLSPGFDFDFDKGIKLWAYDNTTNFLGTICPNLMNDLKVHWKELFGEEKIAEIEALESLPADVLPPVQPNQDLILVGFHGPAHLLYALITTPPLPLTAATPITPCQIVWDGAIPSEKFNDIEGLAYDAKWPLCDLDADSDCCAF